GFYARGHICQLLPEQREQRVDFSAQLGVRDFERADLVDGRLAELVERGGQHIAGRCIRVEWLGVRATGLCQYLFRRPIPQGTLVVGFSRQRLSLRLPSGHPCGMLGSQPIVEAAKLGKLAAVFFGPHRSHQEAPEMYCTWPFALMPKAMRNVVRSASASVW